MSAQPSRSPLRIWCEGRQRPLDVLPIYCLCGHHLWDVERALILASLERCGWNRTHAAKQLGISIRTMRNEITSCMAEGVEIPGHGAIDRAEDLDVLVSSSAWSASCVCSGG
jgi:hypothetical protein